MRLSVVIGGIVVAAAGHVALTMVAMVISPLFALNLPGVSVRLAKMERIETMVPPDMRPAFWAAIDRFADAHDFAGPPHPSHDPMRILDTCYRQGGVMIDVGYLGGGDTMVVSFSAGKRRVEGGSYRWVEDYERVKPGFQFEAYRGP